MNLKTRIERTPAEIALFRAQTEGSWEPPQPEEFTLRDLLAKIDGSRRFMNKGNPINVLLGLTKEVLVAQAQAIAQLKTMVDQMRHELEPGPSVDETANCEHVGEVVSKGRDFVITKLPDDEAEG